MNNMPPPLKPEQTLELFEQCKAGDEEARGKIVEGNLRLVVYCARKFENTGIMLEDLTSIGLIGLMKAVDSFKLDKKIKFATYASRCIDNEILMFLRKQKKINQESKLDHIMSHDVDGNELTLMDVTPDPSIKHFSEAFIEMDTREELQEAIKELNPREQQIIFMRYISDQTQKEVAAALDISQSYISRLEKKVLKKIKKNMERKYKDMPVSDRKIDKVKELLATTKLTYKEIEMVTGVSQGTISKYKDCRPKEVRDELRMRVNSERKIGMQKVHNGDTDLAVQMMAKGGYTYAEIAKRTGVPQGSLTRLRRMYESGNYEWTHEPAKRVEVEVVKPIETPVINEEAFMGEKDLAKKKASIQPVGEAVVYNPQKEYEMVEKKPVMTIPEAIEEFKQDVRKELKEELRKEIEQEMAEQSNAQQTSNIGSIQKRITFKYNASGGRVQASDFIAELNDLVETLQASGNEYVTFTCNVEAE